MTTKNTTIDTAMAKRLVAADTIRSAAIIGQPGGWGVVLKLGMQEKALTSQRTDTPRLWRSLDRCVDYLKSEFGIARFDMLDATQHSNVAIEGRTRNDAAQRMREAHEAAAHNKWFKAEVQKAIDDPRPTIPHAQVMKNVRAAIGKVRAKRASA